MKTTLRSLSLALSLTALACSHGQSSQQTADAGEDPATACPPCTTEAECNGNACVQLGVDTSCAPRCNGDGDCAADRACTSVPDFSGNPIKVCVPRSDVCGPSLVPDDAGPPQEGGTFDGGPPPVGTIGNDGGKLSRLYFGVVGDTRPPSPDDTAGYPTAVITRLYKKMATMSPPPPFAVSTGDYIFASIYKDQAAPQFDLYLAARKNFPGPLFPALGNHECTGATASNCGVGTAADGLTKNYQGFLSKMLGPIGKTDPWYSIRVDAPDGSWTSKFVFIAANAWNDTQSKWLETTMSTPTTYTFVVRHEPTGADAPGVAPSDTIINAHPYTLAIVGHTHTYYRRSTKQVIIGNGGAPLTGSSGFGFGLVTQRADGNIQVDVILDSTGAPDPAFRFAVTPAGNKAP